MKKSDKSGKLSMKREQPENSRQRQNEFYGDDNDDIRVVLPFRKGLNINYRRNKIYYNYESNYSNSLCGFDDLCFSQ